LRKVRKSTSDRAERRSGGRPPTFSSRCSRPAKRSQHLFQNSDRNKFTCTDQLKPLSAKKTRKTCRPQLTSRNRFGPRFRVYVRKTWLGFRSVDGQAIPLSSPARLHRGDGHKKTSSQSLCSSQKINFLESKNPFRPLFLFSSLLLQQSGTVADAPQKLGTFFEGWEPVKELLITRLIKNWVKNANLL
jgi:hypothetical protein